MVKKRKVELYDILANRLSEPAPEDIGANSGPLLSKTRLSQRNGREIVLSLDGAFVIFVIVLLVLGTAYFIGFRKGSAEANLKFSRGKAEGVVRVSDELSLVTEDQRQLRDSVVIAPGKFTLKVLGADKNSRNLARLRNLRMSLLANPIIENSRLGVFIIGNDKNYSLAVGLYERRDDEILINLREYFKENGRRDIPEFRGLSVENVEDLGKPLM